MTIGTLDLARGKRNWDTDMETWAAQVRDDVNTLSLGSLTADTFFSANVQSSAANITLSGTAANLQVITMTTTGKYLRMPSATADGFDGQFIYVINAGSNTFDIQDNDGNELVADVPAGAGVMLHCKTDSDAAGTWAAAQSFGLIDNATAEVMELTSAGVANFKDNQVARADLIDTSETAYSAGNITGAVSIDYTNGHYQYATATGNISGLTVSNWPASGTVGRLTLEIIQDGTGGRTIDLASGGYRSPGGSDITLSSGAGDVDILRFETRDGGTTINVFINSDMVDIT